MTNVWVGPGGTLAAGVAGRPAGLRVRDAFLGTVAAAALSLALGGPALAGLDPCTPSGGGTIETCSGNQSAGIAITSPTAVTTLNVNNLTTAIAPASGTSGISFTSTGAITVNSNTGTYGIITTNSSGVDAAAIKASSTGAGAVTVTSTGNINTTGTGNSYGTGISAYSNGGAVTVTSTGNINTQGNFLTGITALSQGGAVTVTSTGDIVNGGALTWGILAQNNAGTGTGATAVISTGNITVTGPSSYGIVAFGRGAVAVTSTGNITASGDEGIGIFADGAVGISAITVTIKSGTVSGGTGSGVGVVIFNGTNITLTNMGTITALSGLAIPGGKLQQHRQQHRQQFRHGDRQCESGWWHQCLQQSRGRPVQCR